MINDFDFISNLPLLILVFLFLIIFILFLRAIIILLRAKGNFEKIQEGREALLISLYGFFVILLIVFIFFIVSYFLKKGEALQPREITGEFPVSPAVNFPSPPQFIKIDKYYFNGPWLLKKINTINKLSIYAILCKKNDNYDIISIEEAEKDNLLKNKKYNCWIEQCDRNLNNLYTAVFRGNKEIYNLLEIKKIGGELRKEINPPCSPFSE